VSGNERRRRRTPAAQRLSEVERVVVVVVAKVVVSVQRPSNRLSGPRCGTNVDKSDVPLEAREPRAVLHFTDDELVLYLE
jgi:hypothetical protein